MTKTLQELFAPKAPSERKFFNAHVKAIKVTPDANGNGDDVFKASKVKTFKRRKNRMGYDPGEDEKAYDYGNTNGQNSTKKPGGGPVTPVVVVKEDAVDEAAVSQNSEPDKGGGMKFKPGNIKGGYFGVVKGKNKGELYGKAAELAISATGDANRTTIGHFLDSDHGAALAHATNQAEAKKAEDLKTFKDGSKDAEHDKKVSTLCKTLYTHFSKVYHPAYFKKTNEAIDEAGEVTAAPSQAEIYGKRIQEHEWDSIAKGFKQQETYAPGTIRRSLSMGRRVKSHDIIKAEYRKLKHEHETHGD